MRGVLYIEKLFENILKCSKTVKGRFYVTPRQGVEIDTDNLQQNIKECIGRKPLKKNYPLAMMMPPTIQGNSAKNAIQLVQGVGLVGIQGDKRFYQIGIAFVQQTFVKSGEGENGEPANTIKKANRDTNTSKHRIVDDWYDMEKTARDFVRALAGFIIAKNLEKKISIVDDEELGERITPITTVGQDEVSGVYLQFAVRLSESCEVYDYEPECFDGIEEPNIEHTDC